MDQRESRMDRRRESRSKRGEIEQKGKNERRTDGESDVAKRREQEGEKSRIGRRDVKRE
jgi:hypothetical protein